MKTYESKITLRESNLREILAEYFGVEPGNVHFNIVEVGVLDNEHAVNCEIVKELEFPLKPGTTDMPWLNRPGVRDGDTRQEHYCPKPDSK